MKLLQRDEHEFLLCTGHPFQFTSMQKYMSGSLKPIEHGSQVDTR